MIECHPIRSEREWLAMRRQDVTASEVAALFGLHPYKTALELWAEKSGVELKSRESSAMRRGRIMESAVAAAVREERPNWKVRPLRLYYRDPEARLGATPDFLFSHYLTSRRRRLGLIQAKVISPRSFEDNWTAESPPFWIVLQTAHELMLTGYQHGAVAALIVDAWSADVAIYEFERHAGAEERIREKVAAFWKSVDAGEQPPADFSRDGETLAALYPRERIERPDVNMSGDERISALLAERRSLIGSKRSIAERLGKINTELKSILKDAESAYGPRWRVTWRTQSRPPRYDPGGSTRVLRITDRTGRTELIDGDGDQATGSEGSAPARVGF